MGTLIIIRHGESIWNKENRFAGWADISLSKKGLREAKHAAEILKEVKFDTAFTSDLLRAQETMYEILNRNKYSNKYMRVHENDSFWYSHYKHTEEDNLDLKIYINEALNERYYGDLQGLNKDETRKKFGEKLVQIWRRSFRTAPPGGNPLSVTYKRVIPYFKSHIEKRLKKGETILVAAHGNSLRAIIKYLEKIPDREISQIELKTGVPIQYNFDDKMKILRKKELL